MGSVMLFAVELVILITLSFLDTLQLRGLFPMLTPQFSTQLAVGALYGCCLYVCIDVGAALCIPLAFRDRHGTGHFLREQ